MKNIAKSKQGRMIMAITIAIVGISIWAIFRFSKTPAFSQTQLYEVKRGTIETELSEDITFQPGTDIQLAFENSGKIKNILVSVGDQVKKGQLLAEESNSDYVAILNREIAARDAVAAQLKQAQKNVGIQDDKLKGLQKANAPEYDVKAQQKTKSQAKAGVEVQEALLSAAESSINEANLELAKTRLLAPADGVITNKSIEIGEVVSQAGPVMTLMAGNNIEADAFVSELDVKKLSVGDEAQISLSSTDGNNVEVFAKIKNIYPAGTVDNGGPSYKVVFELSEQNAEIKSGMTGEAKIKLSQKSGAINIPQSSLFSDGGKKYVMVMSGGFPERKEIQVGAYGADGTVEVLTGLSEGDKIIKF